MKPGRLEVALDVFADRDGEDDEDADRGEDELRVLPGEVGDAVGSTAGDEDAAPASWTVPDFKVSHFEIQINAVTIV